jgi:2-(3-amino-3-carboxypropyl)histidine synthase
MASCACSSPSCSPSSCACGSSLARAAPAPPPRPGRVAPRLATSIPEDILRDPALTAAISALPANYDFEVRKCVWKLRAAGARRVALQLPEGLLLWACALGAILGRFAGAEVVIMGDVTYGACCVDDLGAAALGCDFLIHYGHSCLVPVDAMAPGVRVLYVFVGIAFDVAHLCATARANFAPGARLVLAGTIQFAGALAAARAELAADFPALAVPQAKPLSPGEVLGCTAPALPPGEADAIIFVADGRFHLEAIMIRNPSVPAFRYDPYGKVMTAEAYDVGAMAGARRRAVAAAAAAAAERPPERKPWGLVLGTLGRQGAPAVLDRLAAALDAAGVAHFTVLLGEISAAKLGAFGARAVGAWVQVACPRLSIDWGEALADAVGAPVLTPFEAHAALGLAPWPGEEGGGGGAAAYPMDYYEKNSGPWTNYYKAPPAKSI